MRCGNAGVESIPLILRISNDAIFSQRTVSICVGDYIQDDTWMMTWVLVTWQPYNVLVAYAT